MYKYFSMVYSIGFKIAFIPIYFGITYSVLLLLGWIKKDDWHDAKKLLHIRKLGGYIRDEIRNK
jgi:hypothetical protein